MKRYLHFKVLLAVIMMVCSTATMSAQTKVTSLDQLKVGSVIKIYPQNNNRPLGCYENEFPLNFPEEGNNWTLIDAGDDLCYLKNELGYYWTFNQSDLGYQMLCRSSEKTPLFLTWNSACKGVNFSVSKGYTLRKIGNQYGWWWSTNNSDGETFDIVLIKEGDGMPVNKRKVNSLKQLKGTSVIRIYPLGSYGMYGRGLDADNKGLLTATGGCGWVLTDAGDGYYYLNDGDGNYWANQNVGEQIKCTNRKNAVKVRIYQNAEDGSFSFVNNDNGHSLGTFSSCCWGSPKSTSFELKLLEDESGEPYNVASFKYRLFSNGTLWLDANNYNGHVNVPQKDGSSDVVGTNVSCFKDCVNLTSVTLSDNIQRLGYCSFENCVNLKKINLPQSVEFIDSRCFRNCTSLETITLPNKITLLPNLCFSGCTGLKSVILSDAITVIYDECFENCSSMKNVALPNSVTAIKDRCFYGCNGLTSMKIPASLKNIGSDVFYNNSKSYDENNLSQRLKVICSAVEPPVNANSESPVCQQPYYLFVPVESVEKYKEATIWNNAKGIFGGSPMESVTLPTEFLLIGTHQKIESQLLPVDASGDQLEWSSSDNTVATVDKNGIVTRKKQGTVTITASSIFNPEISASCKVNVAPLQANDFELETTHVARTIPTKLKVKIIPEEADRPKLKWTSLTPDIASVTEDGTIVGLKLGTAQLKAETENGTNLSKTFNVDVTKIPISAISFPSASITMFKTKTFKIQAVIEPVVAENQKLNWISGNTDIATVDENGVVTAKKVGSTQITATATDGSNVSAAIDVKIEPLKVEEMTFAEPKVLVIKTNDKSITLTLNSEEVDDKTMAWTSSDESVATVKQNLNASYPLVAIVSAHKVGKTIITATAKDGSGMSAACEVEVIPLKVSDFSLQTKSVVKTIPTKMEIIVTPTLADNPMLKWTSLTQDVATVTEEGLVTGLKMGKAKLKAETTDGSNISKTFEIEVEGLPVSTISLPTEPISIVKTRKSKIQAIVEPLEADNPTLKWTSGNTKIATVDESGFVTGWKTGSTRITVTATDGSNVSASVDVTIEPLKVETMTFNEPKVSVIKTNDKSITLTLNSEEVDDKTMLWTSSDESVATVKQNLNASYPLVAIISGHKIGKTIITATATDGSGVSATCEVEVTPLMVSNISTKTTSVVKTIPTMMEMDFTPSEADNQKLKWMSLTPEIATVTEDGMVTGLKMGLAKLKATTTDGSNITKTFEVQVSGLPVSTISLPKESSIIKTEKTKLEYSVLPLASDNQTLKWSSNAPDIATVDENSGVITAHKVGDAIITAMATDGSGISSSTTIHVTPLKVNHLGVTKEITLLRTMTGQIATTIEPELADNKTLKWTSDDANIATVTQEGVVKGVNVGTAHIMATTTDGSDLSAICKVTVSPVGISLSAKTIYLKRGETFASQKVNVLPENYEHKDVTWSSLDDGVASVDGGGVITAVKPGVTTIKYVLDYDSNISSECKVIVYDDNVVCLDGIFYLLDANKKEATVTNVFGGKNTSLEDLRMAQYYSGDIRVPETVSEHGVEYTVKAVGNYAFCCQNGLQSFKMPNTVQRVGFSAFRYAENLTEVQLSASLNSIDMYAFGDCGFSHIKLPESLISILAGAFINDTHLQEITFPEKLQEVGMAAFENNSALESVTFNTAVGSLSVGSNAFNQCPILNKVYIANLANFAQTNFGNAKANPANVSQHIYDVNGKEIINVVLPKGTKYVNNNAFNGCAYIESIEMPATISLIYDNIFYGCSSLRDVYCYATSVPVFKGKQEPADMDDVFHSTTLHVIYGNESAYKADSWWGRFYQVKGCEAPRPDNVKATSIVLNQTQMTMKPDETMLLEAMVYPEDATNRNVTWSNSNDDVAIVTDDGFVLALAEGKTVVTAKTTDGSNLSASCVITVTGITGIGSISLGDVKIIVNKRHLVVKGLADHDVIHVVNAIGFTVYRGQEHEVNLSAPGMYVVKVKGKCVKINVK